MWQPRCVWQVVIHHLKLVRLMTITLQRLPRSSWSTPAAVALKRIKSRGCVRLQHLESVGAATFKLTGWFGGGIGFQKPTLVLRSNGSPSNGRLICHWASELLAAQGLGGCLLHVQLGTLCDVKYAADTAIKAG